MASAGSVSEAKFEIIEEVSVKGVTAGSEAHVWVPFPLEDQYQKVLDFRIKGSTKFQLNFDSEFGNPILYGSLTPDGDFGLEMQYTILKRTPATDFAAKPRVGDFPDELLSRYLVPERHVLVNDETKAIAEKVTGREPDPVSKARRLYDYVVEYMAYDASKQSWLGSTQHALTCQVGNCNDIHSLFISLCRSLRTPARMVMGVALEASQDPNCDVCGYHCWSEFFAPGLGWVPVDASCACKYGKHELFGGLEINHIAFSRGRDILLSPPQKGERLLFFPSAYVEVDGKKHGNVERRISFKPL